MSEEPNSWERGFGAGMIATLAALGAALLVVLHLKPKSAPVPVVPAPQPQPQEQVKLPYPIGFHAVQRPDEVQRPEDPPPSPPSKEAAE